MSSTRGNHSLSNGQPQISIRVEPLVQRWLEAYRYVRGAVRKLRRSRTRDRHTRDRAGMRLAHATDGSPDPQPVEARSLSGGADAPQRDRGSIAERSDALAALCDRLLRELDGDEVKAAEIRFVVHKPQQAGHPRIDPRSAADLAAGELVWELRRLIAWAGGTLDDVVGALETRAGDLDERGRELLQDEVMALDHDLTALKAHLAGPVDWDAEFDHLLAGEVSPFDDPAANEDDDEDG